MIIPYGTDRPQRRTPWMNYALIAANILIFILTNKLTGHTGHQSSDILSGAGLAPQFAPYMLIPTSPHLYQFFTYQFLHQGLMHIAFNMLFLWVFGNNLNEKLGHIGYLLAYLTGGVCAGCGQMLVSYSPTLGASGSISAVTGLYLILLPRTNVKILFLLFVAPYKYEISSLFFILFKIGQDIFEQFAGGSNVAYMAHISGTAAGILIGLLLLATRLVQRDHYDLLGIINHYQRRREYRTLVDKGYDPFAATADARPAARPDVNRAGNADPRIDSLRAEISRLLRVRDNTAAAARYVELTAIDPTQVMAAQEQVDLASQLMSDRQYPQAAAAYEGYLRAYPTGGAGQHTQITLMLALIYGRYENNPQRARQLLENILPSLHDPKEKAFAESELSFLPPSPAARV